MPKSLQDRNEMGSQGWLAFLRSKDLDAAVNIPTEQEFGLAESQRRKTESGMNVNVTNNERKATGKVQAFLLLMFKAGFLTGVVFILIYALALGAIQ